MVHLILPKDPAPSDAAQDRYQRAGATYRAWQTSGALVRDAAAALYVLHQSFEWEGQRHERRGFFARLALQPFSDGVVLPHERTLSGPKADRLKLFRAVQANLSPIFALVEDGGDIQSALESSRAPEVTVRSDDGVENRLWAVRDPVVLSAVVTRLAPRKAYIADGHHRYETGLAYAAELDQATGQSGGAHHSILAYFCGTTDPGLLILPTHRVLHGIANFDAAALVVRLGEAFDVQRVEGSALTARDRLTAAGEQRPAFLMVTAGGSFLVALKPSLDLASFPELPPHAAVRELDVTVLHNLILQRLLGLSAASQERQENLTYVKDAREAAAAVEGGSAQVAFVLNATRMSQVRAVADAGDVMPQKSTFFYPKLPSGLLFNPLDPAEAFVSAR